MFAWPPSFFAPRPAKAPPGRTEALDVAHLGQTYRVRLRRNAAAKRLILRVRNDSGEVILTLPKRTTLGTAREFLARHGGWIADRVARLPEQVSFAEGAVVPLRGDMVRLVSSGQPRGKIALLPADGERPATLLVPGDSAHLPRRVQDFYKAEAKKDIAAAVGRYAAQLNVRIVRISIKDTKSRWGSCSAAGVLSFSWRMIMAPPDVLDYLAAHEVAHRVEMNHSSRYWNVVAEICPHWQRAESWLTRHGAGLHRYGPAGGRPAGC